MENNRNTNIEYTALREKALFHLLEKRIVRALTQNIVSSIRVR
jgi:hypothetical protein